MISRCSSRQLGASCGLAWHSSASHLAAGRVGGRCQPVRVRVRLRLHSWIVTQSHRDNGGTLLHRPLLKMRADTQGMPHAGGAPAREGWQRSANSSMSKSRPRNTALGHCGPILSRAPRHAACSPSADHQARTDKAPEGMRRDQAAGAASRRGPRAVKPRRQTAGPASRQRPPPPKLHVAPVLLRWAPPPGALLTPQPLHSPSASGHGCSDPAAGGTARCPAPAWLAGWWEQIWCIVQHGKRGVQGGLPRSAARTPNWTSHSSNSRAAGGYCIEEREGGLRGQSSLSLPKAGGYQPPTLQPTAEHKPGAAEPHG